MICKTSNVLYAKYNSTRSPEFRITTEICEDADGFFVRKRAGEEAARAHLECIYKNGVDLQDYYNDIRVIIPEYQDGNVRFSYIKGQTLAEQFDSEHFDRELFVSQVNEMLNRVTSFRQCYCVPFQSTDGFEALFGAADIGDVPAVNPANIDSLLTNFIENDSGIYCIDYEWICRFPVPIAFIKYRILLYLYVNQAHAWLNGTSLEEMLGWFGFTEAECAVYWQMDDTFQQHVHGQGRKYIYTDRYRKENLTVAYFEQGMRMRDDTISAQAGLIHDKDVHIGNMEHRISDLQNQVSDKETQIQNQNAQIQDQNARIQDQNAQIQNQNAQIQDQIAQIQGQTAQIQNQNAQIQDQTAQIQNQNAQIQNQNAQIQDQNARIQDQNAQIQRLMIEYQTISNAFFWRITKPARMMLDAFKRVAKRNESVYLFLRTAKDVPNHGLRYALDRRKRYIDDKNRIKAASSWPSAEERERQQRESFPKDITFSILVPLYNTPEKFLRQMIVSVMEQTYEKWELCLADGSDAKHSDVGKVCREFVKADSRIRYRKLKENLGISGNTNACIDMSKGNYIALFDHDDMLHPSALYENMKAICEKEADFVFSDESIFHEEPSDAYYSHFKSDYAPDTLRSYNYICHLTVFKRSLLDEIGGGFRKQFDGSQDYDMVLRLTEKAKHIVHIPRVLYYWRSHSSSVASGVGAKPYTINAGKAALAEHLERVGLKGTVQDSLLPSTYKIQYEINGTPLVSIVIPNMDHMDDLKKCIDSISEKSTWKNWEIIIVENNSKNAETFEYYRSIDKRPEIRLVTWEGGFNFSAICNRGAQAAKGDYILLLNNDIEVITPDWLEQMLMFAQRDDVGAVGPMLYYPDNTIQHAGLIMGIGGSAGHSHKGARRGDYGYLMRLTLAQDLSGVTGACCLVPRHVWEEIGGLDESFAVAFNDVDMCLRIRKAGYLIVWTPYAELYHYESKSRGYEDTPEKKKRFEGERSHLRDRWGELIDAGDPYYNPNLRLDREDFSFR